MADLFDGFGFDDPTPATPKAPAPRREFVPDQPPELANPAKTPCKARARPFGYVCRIGGGDAMFSDNNGNSWFCALHRPKGFFESDRNKGE